MKYLLKQAVILDPSSNYHKQACDVLIQDGIILKIANSLDAEDAQQIALENLHISPSWFDPGVSFGEPGYEHRETIKNGLNVAAKSGFAHIGIQPNTFPVTDSKTQVEFFNSVGSQHAVSLYPIGALTSNAKGEALAELFDMAKEGAISFYDYKKPLTHANILKIALQYAQGFDGLVQSFPMDGTLAGNGQMHEGAISTQLGLKGIPSLCETVQIKRDLEILKYTGGRLHIPTISTKESVALIKEAKAEGLDVSCSVAMHNLILTDEVLIDFDTNYKLLPPLRNETDRAALIEGLQNGVIDGVTTDHNPLEIETKRVEFDFAAFGSIGLESAFGALHTVLPLASCIQALTALKSTFKIPEHAIIEGQKASLTLFNPSKKYVFNSAQISSTSKNAALLNKPLKGVVYGIFSKHKLFLND